MKRGTMRPAKDSMYSPRKNFSDLLIKISDEATRNTHRYEHWSPSGVFDGIYVFGSALWSDTPRDLDILLVYPDERLPAVPDAEKQVRVGLAEDFPGLPIHLTSMSQTELNSTKFLSRIAYVRINIL